MQNSHKHFCIYTVSEAHVCFKVTADLGHCESRSFCSYPTQNKPGLLCDLLKMQIYWAVINKIHFFCPAEMPQL